MRFLHIKKWKPCLHQLNMLKRRTALLLVTCLLASLLAGCRAGGSVENGAENMDSAVVETMAETESEATAEATAADAAEFAENDSRITLIDQSGRQVTLEKPAQKLVSSYYISTAILISLGCEDKLVGIEQKAESRELYRLSAPQIIELPAVGSGKGINVEETAALSPELVILPLRLQESVGAFEELGIPVLVVNPETQEDFEACVKLLGEATGSMARAQELLTYYQEKMEEARNLTADLERPEVYFSSGSDYFSTCTANMYQNDLIVMAGGRNVAEELTEGYWQIVSPEQVLAWNPVYMFSVYDADYSLEDITGDEALAQVQAVQDGKVMRFPSQIEAWDYPTPSSVLGVLWLTSKLHPEVYSQEQYVEEAKEFYNRFFSIEVTEEQIGL